MLAAILDGETWRRLLREPVAWGAFLIGAAPLFGLVALGWSLGAVVVLYWLENLVIGAFALVRLVGAGLVGKIKPAGGPPTPQVDRVLEQAEWPIRIASIAFMAPFFVLHYGMFCFVHGIFVMHLLVAAGPVDGAIDDPIALIGLALDAGQGMVWFVVLIAVWKFVLLTVYFLGRGDVRETSIGEEMMAPYGRIFLLHIAIFAGAFGLALLNEPILGVLALAALKAIFDAQADWRATRMRVRQSDPVT